MKRYYFHIRGPNHFGEDEDGEVFANERSAVAYAERVARELRTEAEPEYYFCSVIVVDEHGAEIFQAPVAPRQ